MQAKQYYIATCKKKETKKLNVYTNVFIFDIL